MSTTETLRSLLRLAWPLKWWIVLSTLLGVATVGCGVGLMATSAYLISAAALHPSVGALAVAIVGVRFFGISRGIFRYAERYVSHSVALRLLSKLRVWFYRGIEPAAPAILAARRSGDLLTRAVSDIETLQDFYVRAVAPPLVAAVVALGMWFLLGAYDLRLAVTFLGFYLLAAAGVPALAHLLGRQVGKELVAARAQLQVVLLDGIQGLADILAFVREQEHEERIRGFNRELLRLQHRLALVNALQTLLTSLLMNSAAVAMLVAAVPLVRDGQLDGVYLALLVLATLASFEAVLPLPTAAAHLGTSLAAAQRLFDLAHQAGRDTRAGGAEPVEEEQSASPAATAISVRGVSFRYSPEEPPALRDASFDVPAGGSVAIVGPSGAGKSTLANLLLKFWEYTEGSITIGGREVRELDGDEVRSLFAVVAQDTHLFNTTIGGNLMIASPSASDEEVWEAVRLARLESFVRSLPNGLDTQVGEQGLLLSGGERQRLAIARAFLRRAPVLLLDEPTANLDPLTEQELMESISTLARGRTTLIITHRLAGIEAASEILVMRDGVIVERGTHDRLIHEQGAYANMRRLQNDVLDVNATPRQRVIS